MGEHRSAPSGGRRRATPCRETTARRHAAVGLHHTVARARHCLFAHARGGRYFGGFWYKVFCERGPC